MEIDRNFSIPGFQTMNFGLRGCILYLWETPRDDKGIPTIEGDRYYYSYRNELCYRITIPRPQEKILKGIVLITRESKNRYRYAAENGDMVRIGQASSLKEIREFCSEFFRESKHGE